VKFRFIGDKVTDHLQEK